MEMAQEKATQKKNAIDLEEAGFLVKI